MKKLMLVSIALVMSAGSMLKAADENLMIKNTTKKPLSYEFVTDLKAKSPTKALLGEIKGGETLAFQPKTSKATVNFYTDGGKTVKVTTNSTGYIVVKDIKDKDIKFTKADDKKDASTALISVDIE